VADCHRYKHRDLPGSYRERRVAPGNASRSSIDTRSILRTWGELATSLHALVATLHTASCTPRIRPGVHVNNEGSDPWPRVLHDELPNATTASQHRLTTAPSRVGGAAGFRESERSRSPSSGSSPRGPNRRNLAANQAATPAIPRAACAELASWLPHRHIAPRRPSCRKAQPTTGKRDPPHFEVIWLLRHLKPDFKTIADFRRDNRDAFRAVFRQFVLLCREMDLFGRYWRVGKKFPTCLEAHV
jgi:hypothetical protein